MPRTALVVDDHPTFRACARDCLLEGYDVVEEASTGAEAIEAATNLRPDLVLLDVQLPDMSGLDVAAALARSETPMDVVLVSSRDAEDYGSLIEQSGARGFIAKADLTAEAVAALLR